MINASEAIANDLDLGFQYAEKSIIPTMDEYASERLQVPKDSLFPNIRAQVQKEFDQVAQVFLEPEKGGVIMAQWVDDIFLLWQGKSDPPVIIRQFQSVPIHSWIEFGNKI